MMIRQKYIESVYVFIQISENKVERNNLETLIRQTEHICASGAKTGLWVVAHWLCGEQTILVTSLREKAQVSEKALIGLREEAETMLLHAGASVR